MSPRASGGPEISHTGQECYIEGGYSQATYLKIFLSSSVLSIYPRSIRDSRRTLIYAGSGVNLTWRRRVVSDIKLVYSIFLRAFITLIIAASMA